MLKFLFAVGLGLTNVHSMDDFRDSQIVSEGLINDQAISEARRVLRKHEDDFCELVWGDAYNN